MPMASEININHLLLPIEFSRCKVFIKCAEQSLHFASKLGYEIFIEYELILGLGTSNHTRAIDSILFHMIAGDTKSLTLFDEHNISHILDVSLISFEVAPQVTDLEPSDIIERAAILKEHGTAAFQLKNLESAFYLYGRAIKYLICLSVTLRMNEVKDDSIMQSLTSLKCLCYLNLAACQLVGTNTQGVIKNCTEALTIEPNNIKAFYRRGQAYSKLKEYDHAIEDLKKATELDPQNRGIMNALAEAKKLLRNENSIMADRLKGIFR